MELGSDVALAAEIYSKIWVGSPPVAVSHTTAVSSGGLAQ